MKQVVLMLWLVGVAYNSQVILGKKIKQILKLQKFVILLKFY